LVGGRERKEEKKVLLLTYEKLQFNKIFNLMNQFLMLITEDFRSYYRTQRARLIKR
jgi:hypothetical protein